MRPVLLGIALSGIAVLAGSRQALPAGCPTPARDRYEPRSFLGYACVDDCERHKAGFAWAVALRVSEPATCTALAPAEAEGCRAYVEERLTPEAAGYRWALENDVADPCLCEGAGTEFGNGCRAQLRSSGAN